MLSPYKEHLRYAINERGLDLDDFGIKDSRRSGYTVTTVRFRGTKLRFEAVEHPKNHHVFFANWTDFHPAFESHARSLDDLFPLDARQLCVYFGCWLDTEVKPYITYMSEPELWDWSCGRRQDNGGNGLREPKTPSFTDQEKRQTRTCVERFRLLLRESLHLTEQQLKAIDGRLDNLSASVDSLSRIDWRTLALSAVLNIPIALSLDTARGRQLVDLFRQVFLSS